MFYFAGTRKPNFHEIKHIDYDAYWKARGFSLNEKLKEREVLISRTIPEGAIVLDIGCGNSRLPLVLKEKGCKVKVADISSVVLAGFKKYGIESTVLDLNKVSETKLPKHDWIIMSEVLEHMTNPEEIVSTLKAYTDNFALTVPNSGFYRFRLHLMFSGRFFTQWVYHPSEHVRFWSHIDFCDWLKALGLSLVSTEASNGLSIFGIKLYKIWPNLFGHQICYFVKTK